MGRQQNPKSYLGVNIIKTVADILNHYRRGNVKTVTAKHNMIRHIRINGKLELREWISGKSYEATFKPGEIVIQSEQGTATFNGIQQEDVNDNFIFWVADNE